MFPAACSLLEASPAIFFRITIPTASNHYRLLLFLEGKNPTMRHPASLQALGNLHEPLLARMGLPQPHRSHVLQAGLPKPGRQLAILTVEGPEVDGEPVGLAKAFPTLPADIRLVPCVSPDMARQLDGLGEHGITVLAGVHFPCSDSQGESLYVTGQEFCLDSA